MHKITKSRDKSDIKPLFKQIFKMNLLTQKAASYQLAFTVATISVLSENRDFNPPIKPHHNSDSIWDPDCTNCI